MKPNERSGTRPAPNKKSGRSGTKRVRNKKNERKRELNKKNEKMLTLSKRNGTVTAMMNTRRNFQVLHRIYTKNNLSFPGATRCRSYMISRIQWGILNGMMGHRFRKKIYCTGRRKSDRRKSCRRRWVYRMGSFFRKVRSPGSPFLSL
jgi:hypothetical protein